MPSHKIHRYITKSLLGKDYKWLDEIIDAPYVINKWKHRQVFGHDKKYSPLWVYLLRENEEDVLAWYIHYKLDNTKTFRKKKNQRKFELILDILDKL